mmetsp:Transcript_15160/g.49723  ORF Transcript_15160/g.49723 Transcript_15160/m.49723 type:complete len:284 (-) Transcript_15160:593-1444(-)
MRVVNLAKAGAEHYWFEPFAALAVGQTLTKRAAVALDEGLAKLVAIVARAVARIEQDLERRGEVGRVLRLAILVVHLLPVHQKVSDAVPCGGSHHERARSRSRGVANAAAGARLRPRVRRHGAREIVCLRGEEEIEVAHLFRETRRASSTAVAAVDASEHRCGSAADSAAVVLEPDDAVVGRGCERLLHHLEERLGLWHAVHHHLPTEKPVARVFAVGLRNVEELDVGRVTPELVAEERRIIVEIEIVPRKAHVTVDSLHRAAALLDDRDGAHRLRYAVRCEG